MMETIWQWMKTILKTAALFACVTQGVGILFVITGSTGIYDVLGLTWHGALGEILTWPGIVVTDHLFGPSASKTALIGTSVLVWFVIWSVVWRILESVKRGVASTVFRTVLSVTKAYGIVPASVVVIWMWLVPAIVTGESFQAVLPRILILPVARLVLCLFVTWYASRLVLTSLLEEKRLRNFFVSTVVIWMIVFYLVS
jgi:hypothetical protein